MKVSAVTFQAPARWCFAPGLGTDEMRLQLATTLHGATHSIMMSQDACSSIRYCIVFHGPLFRERSERANTLRGVLFDAEPDGIAVTKFDLTDIVAPRSPLIVLGACRRNQRRQPVASRA